MKRHVNDLIIARVHIDTEPNMAFAMHHCMFFVVFAAVISVFQVNTNATDVDNIRSEDFDVKPGGMVQEHELTWVSSSLADRHVILNCHLKLEVKHSRNRFKN